MGNEVPGIKPLRAGDGIGFDIEGCDEEPCREAEEQGAEGMTIEIRSLLKEIEETQTLLKTYIRSLK